MSPSSPPAAFPVSFHVHPGSTRVDTANEPRWPGALSFGAVPCAFEPAPLLILNAADEVHRAGDPAQVPEIYGLSGTSPFWNIARQKRRDLCARYDALRAEAADTGSTTAKVRAAGAKVQAECVRVEIARLDASAERIFRQDERGIWGCNARRARELQSMAAEAFQLVGYFVRRNEKDQRQELPDPAPPLGHGVGLAWNRYLNERRATASLLSSIEAALAPLAATPEDRRTAHDVAKIDSLLAECKLAFRRIRALDNDIAQAHLGCLQEAALDWKAIARDEEAYVEQRAMTAATRAGGEVFVLMAPAHGGYQMRNVPDEPTVSTLLLPPPAMPFLPKAPGDERHLLAGDEVEEVDALDDADWQQEIERLSAAFPRLMHIGDQDLGHEDAPA